MHRIVLAAALSVPLFAIAQGECPKGYQPYANRCVTQRMADYISCIEASGGNKQAIFDEISQMGGNETGGSISASGGSAVVKGAGSLTLDKKSESALVKKLEAKWFPVGMSECAKVLKPQSTGQKTTRQNLISGGSDCNGNPMPSNMTTEIVKNGNITTITEKSGGSTWVRTIETSGEKQTVSCAVKQ